MSMCGDINRRRGVKRRDEFPPFSSQSRKSRRLDCQYTSTCEQGAVNCEVEPRLLQLNESVINCTPVHHDNDVPVDPVHIPFQPADLLRTPSSPMLEIKVHPDLVDVLRNYQYQITSAYTPEEKDQTMNYPSTASNLAVIPWVDPNIIGQSKSTREPMEADNDSEMMDAEECNESSNTSEGLQQHPQPQHCLPLQVSQNIAFPVPWR